MRKYNKCNFKALSLCHEVRGKIICILDISLIFNSVKGLRAHLADTMMTTNFRSKFQG